MGRTLLTLILGTGLIALSVFLFPNGLLGTFFSISEYFTNPNFIMQEAAGGVDMQAQVFVVIKFIISVGAYYMLAAILVFVVGLLMPKKKTD